MRRYKRSFTSGVTAASGRFRIAGLALLAVMATLAIAAACTATKPAATPTPAPGPTAKSAPAPAPTRTGMQVGERFHEIHANKLQLKCEVCHSKVIETFYDPLAQASNPADRRACLSCHKEQSIQPFYGESWDKAKVK